jgi:hypothetical protein
MFYNDAYVCNYDNIANISLLADVNLRKTISITVELGEECARVAKALADTGASGVFMDLDWAKEQGFKITPREHPVVVRDAQKKLLGIISKQVTTRMKIKNHYEDITFDLIKIAYPVILGVSWHKLHEVQFDWKKNDLVFNSNYCQDNCIYNEEEEKEQLGEPEVNSLEEAGFNSWEEARLFAIDLEEEEEINAMGFENLEEEDRVREAIPAEYHEFLGNVFAKKWTEELPERSEWDFKIELKPGEEPPPPARPYKMTEKERSLTWEWIQKMLNQGFIRPSKSQTAAPVFWIQNETKKRMIIDYRALNAKTVKDAYGPAGMDLALEAASGNEWFTTLDMKDAYYKCRIAEGCEYLTAITTPFGNFEFLVMGLGFVNAPSHWQRRMNSTLASEIGRGGTAAYMDDILNASKSKSLNIEKDKRVLRILKEAKIPLQPLKCKFNQKEVDFLGVKVNGKGFKMQEKKIKAIQDWGRPGNPSEILSFTGFANFYRRFIPNFSKLCVPLYALTKKDAPWAWEKEQEEAFNRLKEQFAEGKVLAHPDHSLPWELKVDVSLWAVGAVLSQKHGNVNKPVGFFSKALSLAERKYDPGDREMLAIVKGLEHFKFFIMDSKWPIEVWTDHKNILAWVNKSSYRDRHWRWLDRLMCFDYKMNWLPGKKNSQADFLSRRADLKPEGEILLDKTAIDNFREKILAINPVDSDQVIQLKIKVAIRQDPALRKIVAHLEEKGQVPHAWEKAIQDFSLKDDLLMFKGKIYVPNDKDIKTSIMELYHDSVLAGHPGQMQTMEMVSRMYTWPSMKNYIGQYVLECEDCQRNKNRHSKSHGLLQPLPIPDGPWQHISYDYIGELPNSNGYNAILVAICRLTKMGVFIPASTSDDAKTTAMRFRRWVWRHYGLPKETISDRGVQFNNAFLKGLYEHLGIKANFSTSFRPQTDGQTERTNAIIETYLRIFCDYRQDDWEDYLDLAEFAYNNRASSSTGVSPFFALYGFHPNFGTVPALQQPSTLADQSALELERIRRELKASLRIAQERQAEFYNRKHAVEPEFRPGERVWVEAVNISTDQPSGKLAAKRIGPYEVESRVGSRAYRLRLPRNMQIHPVFHVSLLSRYHSPTLHRSQADPPQAAVKPEYSIPVFERILSSRIWRGRLQYKVRWAGKSAAYDSWVDWGRLRSDPVVDEHLDVYHLRYPDAPGPTWVSASGRIAKRPAERGNIRTDGTGLRFRIMRPGIDVGNRSSEGHDRINERRSRKGEGQATRKKPEPSRMVLRSRGAT